MAAKIKDGLFIGDAETSQSEVFINDNKISNLINLAGREVQNIWSSHGLVYLTYYWEDRPDYKLFVNHEDTMLTDLVEFIDVSIAHGISVLLFSRRGTGRCVIAACLYLMMKYRWGFEKTYDYVYSKKPDIELNKGFIQQMFALDMKLLAARQKAFAIRNGIESTFKIEANMTIADIAAMLPPSEAKRWNAWDTDYLTEGENAEEGGEDAKLERKGNSSSSSDFKSDRFRRSQNNTSGRNLNAKLKFEVQKPEDAAEELVLIYSFINSKNTINALPGPYRNVYDTPKQFKLKFDAVPQEEDIHMFPTTPPRYPHPTRSILKGSASHQAAQAKTRQQQQQQQQLLMQQQQQQQSVLYDGEKQQQQYHQSAAASSRKDQSLLESIQPLYVINNARKPANGSVSGYPSGSGAGAASGAGQAGELRRISSAGSEDFDLLYGAMHQSAPPSKGLRASYDSGVSAQAEAKSSSLGVNKQQSQQQQQQHRPNDLYGFVGMTSENRHSNTASSSNSGGGYAESKHSSDSAVAAANQLTAEDRLRNLMADMQRQTYYKDGDRNTSGGGGSSSSHAHASAAGPSLYDLANMTFHTPASSHTNNNISSSHDHMNHHSSNSYGRSSSSAAAAGAPSVSVPSGYDEDPLSAFEMLQQQNAKLQSSQSGGAVRARHDIVANSSSGGGSASGANSYLNSGRGQPVIPAGPRAPIKNAWAPIDSNTAAGSASSAGNVRSNSLAGRPLSASGAQNTTSSSSSGRASPTVHRQQQQQQQSSNSSVASVSSGVSSITQQQQQQSVQSVGAGASSSSRVYRHGSPAPNNRTTRPVVSSGYGASNSGIGSSSMRPSQPARAPSPIGGVSSARDNSSSYGTPQRRLSNSSFTTMGSSGPASNTSTQQQQQQTTDRRRLVGSSPLRASTSSNASNSSANPPAAGGGVTSKRYSTPTPQSQQHNEYDSGNSGGLSGSLRGNTAVRSGTPTRNTWRF